MGIYGGAKRLELRPAAPDGPAQPTKDEQRRPIAEEVLRATVDRRELSQRPPAKFDCAGAAPNAKGASLDAPEVPGGAAVAGPGGTTGGASGGTPGGWFASGPGGGPGIDQT